MVMGLMVIGVNGDGGNDIFNRHVDHNDYEKKESNEISLYPN